MKWSRRATGPHHNLRGGCDHAIIVTMALFTVPLWASVLSCWALVLSRVPRTNGFAPATQRCVSERQTSGRPAAVAMKLAMANDDEDETGTQDDMNPLTKASWYAVEAFGKAFGSKNLKQSASVGGTLDLTKPPSSLTETLERIQLDNDRSYFLSGEVDKLIYEENCVFADPFVSFAGRDRFVENLANLGSFITKYSARMLDYDAVDDATVKTKVMVKLQLNLPWKPVLAWPWGVTYEIDPDTCLITRHEESWEIKPWEGVKQIFRKPTVDIK